MVRKIHNNMNMKELTVSVGDGVTGLAVGIWVGLIDTDGTSDGISDGIEEVEGDSVSWDGAVDSDGALDSDGAPVGTSVGFFVGCVF